MCLKKVNSDPKYVITNQSVGCESDGIGFQRGNWDLNFCCYRYRIWGVIIMAYLGPLAVFMERGVVSDQMPEQIINGTDK